MPVNHSAVGVELGRGAPWTRVFIHFFLAVWVSRGILSVVGGTILDAERKETHGVVF